MLLKHDGQRQLRVLTLHMEHSALLTHAWSKGMPGFTTGTPTRQPLSHLSWLTEMAPEWHQADILDPHWA